MMRTAQSSMRSCTAVAVADASRKLSQVLTATRKPSGTSSHASSCRRKLLRMALLEKIAEPAQREDRRIAGLELLAQARHVDLDRVRVGAVVHREQAIGDRLLADRLALLHHQRFEDRVLAGRQRQRALRDREQARVAVVAQRAAFEHRVPVLSRTAQDRADARLELADVEWLG